MSFFIFVLLCEHRSFLYYITKKNGLQENNKKMIENKL